MQTLDETTIQRIKDCKRHGFPICLEEAILRIFLEEQGELLINRYIEKLAIGSRPIESAELIWETYDQVLRELGKELGEDVSQVIEYQSIKEMEAMRGCLSCPLYRRRATRQ